MSLDSYTKLRVIGKGSYGEVWLVKHKKDKKQVGVNSFPFVLPLSVCLDHHDALSGIHITVCLMSSLL